MTVPNEPITYEEDGIPLGGDKRRWVLVLNQYQRDNLLGLLNVVGYGGHDPDAPYGNAGSVEPFGLLNTGDWVGEVALKLGMPNSPHPLDAERTGRVNQSREVLTRMAKERVRDLALGRKHG